MCLENKRCTQQVSKRTRRTFATLVVTICSDPEVQPHLPHWLLCNEKAVSAAAAVALPPLSHNVRLQRGKSAWTNAAFIRDMVRSLGEALQHVKDQLQPILLMDAAPQHVQSSVLAQARQSGIFVAFVPACATGVVQPCDVGCLAMLKEALANECREMALQDERGKLTPTKWLGAIAGSLRVLRRDWSHVFRETGCFGESDVGHRVWERLGVDPVVLSNECPSGDRLDSLMPRARYKVSAAALRGQVQTTVFGPPPLPSAARVPRRRLSTKTRL